MTRAPSPGTVAFLALSTMYAEEPYPHWRVKRGRRKTAAEVKEAEQRKAARKRQKSARKASR